MIHSPGETKRNRCAARARKSWHDCQDEHRVLRDNISENQEELKDDAPEAYKTSTPKPFHSPATSSPELVLLFTLLQLLIVLSHIIAFANAMPAPIIESRVFSSRPFGVERTEPTVSTFRVEPSSGADHLRGHEEDGVYLLSLLQRLNLDAPTHHIEGRKSAMIILCSDATSDGNGNDIFGQFETSILTDAAVVTVYDEATGQIEVRSSTVFVKRYANKTVPERWEVPVPQWGSSAEIARSILPTPPPTPLSVVRAQDAATRREAQRNLGASGAQCKPNQLIKRFPSDFIGPLQPLQTSLTRAVIDPRLQPRNDFLPIAPTRPATPDVQVKQEAIDTIHIPKTPNLSPKVTNDSLLSLDTISDLASEFDELDSPRSSGNLGDNEHSPEPATNNAKDAVAVTIHEDPLSPLLVYFSDEVRPLARQLLTVLGPLAHSKHGHVLLHLFVETIHFNHHFTPMIFADIVEEIPIPADVYEQARDCATHIIHILELYVGLITASTLVHTLQNRSILPRPTQTLEVVSRMST